MNPRLAAFALFACLACGKDPSEPAAAAPAAPEDAAAPEGRVELPASPASAIPDGPAAGKPRRTELSFRTPESWIAEEPAVPLRKLQLRVPRVAGDTHDAELTVLFRGAIGLGPLDAQLTRWAQQFTQPDGASSRERLKLSTRKVGGASVTEAELEGTCVAEKSPGSPERWNEPRWKLLGAVIESEFGPYYVRLLGPQATVDANASAFRAFLESSAE